MKLDATVIIKKATIDELMTCYKREEVLGYCQNCDQYGQNYSCPGHGFDEAAYVKGYTHAVLILTEISTQEIKGSQIELSTLKLSSRVLDQHRTKQGAEPIEPETALAMFVYDAVKSEMTARLLRFEENYDGTVGLPPGSCTSCDVCLKSMGGECPQPERLRYSLESLGFKVSDLYSRFFDRTLQWTKGELPEAFHTCSAILSQEELEEETIRAFFSGITVSFPIER